MGTVTDRTTLGKGTTGAWTRIHTTLILASAIGGTVIVGGAFGSTGWGNTIIVGQAAADRLTLTLATFGIGTTWRGLAGILIDFH